jgi:ABC-type lipoprotein release transport system permease subunit
MAEREAEHKRIVVETPNARREEVYTQAARYPEERSGISGAALAAIVVGVVALAAIIILFVMNQQQNANDNATAQQQPQTIIQQPAQQQPPVIVQQPAPAAQPPVIINGQPAPAAPASGGATSKAPDDSTVQAAVDKKLSDDPALSALGITVTVMNGKATLIGSVHTAAEKNQVERAVRNVKGVKSIDNQITVSGE